LDDLKDALKEPRFEPGSYRITFGSIASSSPFQYTLTKLQFDVTYSEPRMVSRSEY
jgi:hypothetical protein